MFRRVQFNKVLDSSIYVNHEMMDSYCTTYNY